MTTVYNSFSAWLEGQGLGSYIDGSGELANGTSQGFFSSQYTAWLSSVVDAYAANIRTAFGYPSDWTISVTSINQNDPSGLPVIQGLTAAQVDILFNGTMDFSWTTSGKKPVEHVRYYSNEFNFSAVTVAADTTAPGAPVVALTSDTGSSGSDLITSNGALTVTPAEGGGTIQYSTDGGATWTGAFTAAEGANSVMVRQVDAAGNEGAATTFAFTLDTVRPTDIRITVSSALAAAVVGLTTSGNSTANNSTGTGTVIGTLSASANDPGNSFAVVGASIFEISDGDQLKLVAGSEIKEGDAPVSVTIKVTDLAGNEYYETFTFKAGQASSSAEAITGTNFSGTGTLADPVFGDDFIFGFRGPDSLNSDGVTVFGTSGDDALFGGNGADKLYGGAGNDQLYGGVENDQLFGGTGNDILYGGAGDDQFRMIAPSGNGLDTVKNFLTGSNKVGLLQSGDGWNAAGTTPSAGAFSNLASTDYVNRTTVQGISSVGGDTNKVVEIQSAQTAVEISAAVATATAVNAYGVVFNSTTGRGELWFDTNWSDTAGRVQMATFDDITTLAQLTGLSSANFGEWL